MGGSIGLGAAGSIVAAFGYNAAFLTLAAVAVIALLVMVVAMPETRPTPGKLDQPLLGMVHERDSHPGRGRHSCQLANHFVFRSRPALKRAAFG
jgi:predicted MFS family arabinose efflux permease